MTSWKQWWQNPNLINELIEEFGDNQTSLFLKKQFSKLENKFAFANICFPEHLQTESPPFHEELLTNLSSPENFAGAAPRGFAKSTLMMIDDCWDIVNANRHHIVRISDTYTQSLEHLMTLQFELEYNPILRWIYGELKTEHWNQEEFVASTDVKVVAKGAGMKIRGLKYKQYRPDKIEIDDLENDEAVSNQERRVKLAWWFKMAVLPALAVNGKINFLGTILHSDSLLAHATSGVGEFKGWKNKIYSAIDQNNQSIWPQQWPLEKLESIRSNPEDPNYVGSLVFSQEYQNKPVNERDAIVKRSWIKYWETLPELKTKIIIVDPAISKNEKADFSAIQCWAKGIDKNDYLVEKDKNHYSFNELGEAVRALYHRVNNRDNKKVDAIYIEITAYQAALKENDSLKDLPIRTFVPVKDKRTRLVVVSKFFEAGKVFIGSDMSSVVEEVVGFGSVAHDDECDCVTAGLHLLNNSDTITSNDYFFG